MNMGNKMVIYGLGGFCEDCSIEHDHPLNNIIEEIEIINNLEDKNIVDGVVNGN